MHLQGKPVCSFDPEGLIFAAGINSEMVKLYDLRSFDKVRRFGMSKRMLKIWTCSKLSPVEASQKCHLLLFVNRVHLQPSSSSMTEPVSGRGSSSAMTEN